MRISDWSSDVCSSDLLAGAARLSSRRPCPPPDGGSAAAAAERAQRADPRRDRVGRLSRSGDRKSVVQGKSVSVRVDLGGRRILKKKNKRKSSSHNISVKKYIYITNKLT